MRFVTIGVICVLRRMNSLATNQIEIRATAVRVSDDALIIDLTDGRTVSGMVSAIAAWHRCRAARASINRPGPRNSLAAAGRRHQRGRNPCRKAVIREQGIVRGVARLTVPGELNPAQFEGEKRYWLHPPTSRSRGTTARQARLRRATARQASPAMSPRSFPG